MPLRATLPALIGTDIVRIARLAKYAAPSPATARFARRFLTPREVAAFESAAVSGRRRVQFLASRWAAKEAVIKAVPRRVYHRDVEIYSRADGAPFAVVLDSRAAGRAVGEIPARGPGLVAEVRDLKDLDGAVVGLSIAHEDEYAVAVAVADGADFKAD